MSKKSSDLVEDTINPEENTPVEGLSTRIWLSGLVVLVLALLYYLQG